MASTVAESRPPLSSTTAFFGCQSARSLQVPALADVHRGRNGIVFVDVGLDAFVQQALGIEDELDGVARRAVAAAVRALHSGPRPSPARAHRPPRLRSRIAHHRQVDHVVAHVSNLIQRHAALSMISRTAFILNAWPW